MIQDKINLLSTVCSSWKLLKRFWLQLNFCAFTNLQLFVSEFSDELNVCEISPFQVTPTYGRIFLWTCQIQSVHKWFRIKLPTKAWLKRKSPIKQNQTILFHLTKVQHTSFVKFQPISETKLDVTTKKRYCKTSIIDQKFRLM